MWANLMFWTHNDNDKDDESNRRVTFSANGSAYVDVQKLVTSAYFKKDIDEMKVFYDSIKRKADNSCY